MAAESAAPPPPPPASPPPAAAESALQPPATTEDVEKFIKDNNRWIDDGAAAELRGMNPQDQRRVIAGGTIVSCRDASGVMRSRVRQAREKEALLAGAARNDGNASQNVTVITPGGGGRLSKPATQEELDTFIASNRRWLNEEGEQILRAMSPLDQKRVIAAGTMSGCRDPVAVVQTRAKKARDMEAEFEQLTKGKKQDDKPAAVPSIAVPQFTAGAAVAYVYAMPQEVAKEESKFASATPGKTVPLKETPSAAKLLMGDTKGIGGVVETLKAKYGCARGQRLRVVGETSTLWQFEGGKTAPKNHAGSGFRWVMREEEEARLAKEAEARRKEEQSLQKQLELERKAKEEEEAYMRWEKEHRRDSEEGGVKFHVEDDADADIAQLLELESQLAACLQAAEASKSSAKEASAEKRGKSEEAAPEEAPENGSSTKENKEADDTAGQKPAVQEIPADEDSRSKSRDKDKRKSRSKSKSKSKSKDRDSRSRSRDGSKGRDRDRDRRKDKEKGSDKEDRGRRRDRRRKSSSSSDSRKSRKSSSRSDSRRKSSRSSSSSSSRRRSKRRRSR